MRVERSSFAEEAYPRSLFRDLHCECPGLFFIALQGFQLIGYITSCMQAKQGEIISIAVGPQWRKTGAGTALMERTLAAMKKRRIGVIELMVRTTNASAVRFYKRFGFKRVRTLQQYYEDRAPAFLMRKIIR